MRIQQQSRRHWPFWLAVGLWLSALPPRLVRNSLIICQYRPPRRRGGTDARRGSRFSSCATGACANSATGYNGQYSPGRQHCSRPPNSEPVTKPAVRSGGARRQCAIRPRNAADYRRPALANYPARPEQGAPRPVKGTGAPRRPCLAGWRLCACRFGLASATKPVQLRAGSPARGLRDQRGGLRIEGKVGDAKIRLGRFHSTL